MNVHLTFKYSILQVIFIFKAALGRGRLCLRGKQIVRSVCKPSAFHRDGVVKELQNNLFDITCDGRPVRYQGMTKTRATG